MTVRQILYYIATAAVAVVIGLLWAWQPERQVRRHTERLIAEAEDKDWQKMELLIAEEYSDRWGHHRAEVVDRSRQVLAQFLILELKAEEIAVQEADGIGTARTRLQLSGRGSPLAEYAIDRVRNLKQPFVFHWRLRAWKPWDWVLTNVEQPELEISEY